MSGKGPDAGIEIINAAIKGGVKAYNEYYMLSGGFWLHNAPEYFLTTHAALALKKFDSTTLALEVSVKESRKEANAVKNGRPSGGERRGGRYDIVLYRADGKPRGCLEVKSRIFSVDRKRLVPDFVRLCKTLNSKSRSSIQFSGLLFYSSISEPKQGSDNEKQRLGKLIQRVSNLAKESTDKYGVSHTLVQGKIHVDRDWGGAWCVSCIVFSNTGTEQSFR